MRAPSPRAAIEGLLSAAGIAVGGSRPWDLRVMNEAFFSSAASDGSLGFGESYMEGWWDVERLDEFFYRAFMADLYPRIARGLRSSLEALAARWLNRQNIRRSMDVARTHYNLGNELFSAMLDRRMCYTCAYWKGARRLDAAQEAKLDLICRKLELRPGISVLELGCGWGAFAKYAAERYGTRVLGVNIAEEQVKLGRTLCRGLPVELRVQDYRDVSGEFDRVVSIGIMEHVGPLNHRAYMERAFHCLKKGGIAFVHTIAQNVSSHRCDPWFDKYVFPNAVTPSLSQLGAAMEGLFVLEDCQNIGPHYDPTLMAWHANLERAWPDLKERYDERFHRMMRFYLLSSAGCFRSRRSQVYQMVLTKEGRRQPNCRVDAARDREHMTGGAAP